jgi:hypothetical protein
METNNGTTQNTNPPVENQTNSSGSVLVDKPVIVPDKSDSEEQKKYRVTKQFEDWVQYFLDKNNKTTYGNKTQSAIFAYSLDPIKQYFSAGVIGYDNYKKLKSLASSYLEGKGITTGRMLDIAVAKLLDRNGSIAWWDRIAELTGIKEAQGEKTPQGDSKTQINIFNLNSPEVNDFNSKFEKFLQTL